MLVTALQRARRAKIKEACAVRASSRLTVLHVGPLQILIRWSKEVQWDAVNHIGARPESAKAAQWPPMTEFRWDTLKPKEAKWSQWTIVRFERTRISDHANTCLRASHGGQKKRTCRFTVSYCRDLNARRPKGEDGKVGNR